MQGPNAYRISKIQLEEFARTVNALMRDGVLTCRAQSPKQVQQMDEVEAAQVVPSLE